MTEKFERKPGVPAERDVAKRSYYLSEGRIRTLYHYPDGDVTRARKVFIFLFRFLCTRADIRRQGYCTFFW